MASAPDQPRTRVVIAGGGTAGWIAAAALSKHLGPLLDITLVESDEIGTVGVGESTIPTARSFHRLLGIDEQAFMRATGATFKLGIAFEHWGDVGDRYIHSFGQVGRSTWLAPFQHMWLQARAQGFGGELGDYCLELQAAEAERFATSDQRQLSYAYHLDAGRYAQFLRRFSEAAGTRRIEGRIVGVRQHATTGEIAALALDGDRQVKGDLFIDCTGFRGLLIEQTLKAGYEDWSYWLPTDSALAVQTSSTGPALPYTRAMAHRAGWQWRIPLQHRVGNGLVYCSEYLSEDEAVAMLASAVDGRMVAEPRLIRYRTGRRLSVWDRNCVALGLASGFVEPLESTSIHLIMIAVTRLIQMFPFGGASPALARRYNALARSELEAVRDFIILHYHLTQREDASFWQRCRTKAIPDTLAERIAMFRDEAAVYASADELFRTDSWLQVMLGQRLQPRRFQRVGHLLPAEQLRDALQSLKSGIAQSVNEMPAHQAFLESYCS